jgi:ribosomal protein S5
VAKQSGKQGSTDIQGHATPEMRAAIEQAAQQANAELAKINRQMCEKTVTETCKQS